MLSKPVEPEKDRVYRFVAILFSIDVKELLFYKFSLFIDIYK